MGGPAIILNGNNWQNFAMTGGFLQNNSQSFKCPSFGATIAATTMTVTSASCGTNVSGIQPGMIITGSGVATDTYVTGSSFTGTGTTGTYTITPSQTIASTTTMAASASTEILVNGGGGNNTYASFTNIEWATTGQTPQYDILGNSAGNYNIQFTGGNASDTGNAKTYNTSFSRWLPSTSPPKTLQIDTLGLPFNRTGRGDLSMTTTGALGLSTTAPHAGTILDMSGAQSSQSSLILPQDTTANRPATPVNGMMRLNTSTNGLGATLGVEAYYNNVWNNFIPQSAITVLTQEISGLKIANDLVTPNTIIDVEPGSATSDDGTTQMLLLNQTTKTTGSWTVGSGTGCLNTGSVENSSWYFIFMIERTDTNVVDFLCSLSITAPTMPANYTEKRLVGFVETDASAHILPFQMNNNSYVWKTPTNDINVGLADTTTTSWKLLTFLPVFAYHPSAITRLLELVMLFVG